MKELDQLVENFFQPKRDTLGLDQLVEMVEEVMNEAKYSTQNVNQILTTLGNDERFKDAKVHSSTSNRIYITNMGSAVNRSEALDLIGAKKTMPYKKGSQYYIGGVMEPEGYTVVFKAGRNPFAKENIAYSDLKKSIIEIAKELDELDIANSVTFMFSNPNTGYTETIEDVDLTQEPKDPGKSGKADFSIDDKIFISHKDGANAKDFGQYGGITNLKKYDDVNKFIAEVNKILKDLGLSDYPSGIDFQKQITEDDVLLAGVFGKDFANESSGKNAVDFLIQGDINFETFINEPDDKNPQAFINIGGKKIYSRKEALAFSAASKNTGRVKEIFVNDISYIPMLSVRRGESSRKNLGPDVSGARAAIQAAEGRYANFILKPTKKGIEFFSRKMDDKQIKNVQKLEKQLSEKTTTRENNPMLDKMLSSISNYPLTNPPQ
jgi:hypothetical protein